MAMAPANLPTSLQDNPLLEGETQRCCYSEAKKAMAKMFRG